MIISFQLDPNGEFVLTFETTKLIDRKWVPDGEDSEPVRGWALCEDEDGNRTIHPLVILEGLLMTDNEFCECTHSVNPMAVYRRAL